MDNIKVKVAGLTIGNEREVIVQTMCNTPTADVEASLEQCRKLAKAGAGIIRLTTQGPKEVEALAIIKQKLRNEGITTPLVADVHFSYTVAHLAAAVADKVRINPGNFAKERERATIEFAKLVKICKENDTALRIGVNHGSLGEYNTQKFGNTPQGMAAVAMEWIGMAQENSFNQIIISLKASNPLVMTSAYQLLYKMMEESGIIYPLHLGVTEAGNGDEGRIKSALGIAALLKKSIGNTIRVSLTENPANEIPVAKEIATYMESRRNDLNPMPAEYWCDSYEQFIIRASCDYGPLLLEKEIDDFNIKAYVNQEEIPAKEMEAFKENLFQAARRRFTKPEYIACPGCGRTLYNLEEVFQKVKEKTSHLVGYNIAVMGCIVNGPGEMADADYGYVGEGHNKVSIYRGKEAVYRSVPQEEAIDKLLDLIEEDARNKTFLPRI